MQIRGLRRGWVRALVLLSVLLAVATTTLVASPRPSAATSYDSSVYVYDVRFDVAQHSASSRAQVEILDMDGPSSVELRPWIPGPSRRRSVHFIAPNGLVDDFVDLTTPSRRTHILDGDATGGGHLWPGQPGKSPFPQGWSGDRVIHEISDVATDPLSTSVTQGSRSVVSGVRDGVEIRVIVDNATGEIITGYPTSLPRNPG